MKRVFLNIILLASPLVGACKMYITNDTSKTVYITDLNKNTGQLLLQGNTEQLGSQFFKKGRFEISVGTRKNKDRYLVHVPCPGDHVIKTTVSEIEKSPRKNRVQKEYRVIKVRGKKQ